MDLFAFPSKSSASVLFYDKCLTRVALFARANSAEHDSSKPVGMGEYYKLDKKDLGFHPCTYL